MKLDFETRSYHHRIGLRTSIQRNPLLSQSFDSSRLDPPNATWLPTPQTPHTSVKRRKMREQLRECIFERNERIIHIHCLP